MNKSKNIIKPPAMINKFIIEFDKKPMSVMYENLAFPIA